MACKLGYRFLGSSGIKVSNLCLGTMTFGENPGGPPQCSEAEAHQILDRFAEMGGNFIDTADIYQRGKSEEILGNWLKKQNRNRFIIATKVFHGWDEENINKSGLSRNHILSAVEESLKRLQTSYIDLYQIHCWDDGVPIEETLSTLNQLVEQGKVRYLGVSNVTGWQLQKMADLTKHHGWAPITSLQQQWSLLCRHTEYEVIDVCKNEGIGVLPWSPLKGGWLSGKIRCGQTELPVDSRVGWVSQEAMASQRNQSHPYYEQFNNDKTWKMLDLLKDIGQEHGKSVAQVALRWLLQQGTVPSVVIGVKTLGQLEDNLGASSGWKLSEHQMSALNDASAIEIPYPYEMVTRMNKGRQRTGVE